MAATDFDDLDDLLELTEDDTKSPAAPAEAAVEEFVAEPVVVSVPTEKINPEPGEGDVVVAAPVKKTRAPRKPKEAPVLEPMNDPSLRGDDGRVYVETDAQKRIRELEEELAAADEVHVVEGPSAEDLKIAELERKIKAKKEAAIDNAPVSYEKPIDGAETLVIHFLSDGLIINGVTTYKGQEMEFVVGGPAWEQTKDRNGDTFLDLVDDPEGQYARYGVQYFARGPWRGLAWGQVPAGITDPEEIAAIKAAAAKQRSASRQAPVITL